MTDTRLLIVAGEVAREPDAIPPSVRALIDSAEEILVVAPSLPGPLDWLASATDRARSQADERLRAVLGQLDEMGATARGEIGADDPVLAFDDAVRQFGPHHILIALRRAGRAGWQESGLLDQIVQRFAVPLTVFQFSDD